jgi:hypothetical protein
VIMRSMMIRVLALMATASLVLTASGCGDGPRLVPASGTVTLDGEPLEGATVSFVPVEGNSVSTAGTEMTGPKGNFQMTHNGRSGLASGKYKVMISKTEEVASKNGKEVSPIFAKASFEKQLMGLAKETIPPQNFDREVEVPEGGATDFALDFKSKGKDKNRKK